MLEYWRPYLLLAPALAIILGLFMGGLLLGLMQSLGYLPVIGRHDMSLQAYQSIFQREDFYRSLNLSLWISFASTSISTVLAIICALAIRRLKKYRQIVRFIFQLNIPIPHLVGAIGVLFLFSQSGFLARIAYLFQWIDEPGDFPILVNDPYAIGIILEYVWKETCFIGIIILAVMESTGSALEEVAQNLGASRWQRFRYVILPLIMPAVLSASILVFAFSFGAFEVPLLLGERYPSALPVLAYRYYTDIDLNARPEAMAMGIFIAIVISILIYLYSKFSEIYIR